MGTIYAAKSWLSLTQSVVWDSAIEYVIKPSLEAILIILLLIEVFIFKFNTT